MTAPERRMGGQAEELRRAFDRSFAAPFTPRADDIERFLAVRIGRDAYALRIGEIAGLAAARRIVPIPSALPDVLGLAGVRGNVIPVYNLETLMGHGSSGESPRWFVLCGETEVVGLAFAELDGYLELPRSALFSVGPGGHEGKHVRDMLHVSEGARRIISISSLVETIKERISAVGAMKEP